MLALPTVPNPLTPMRDAHDDPDTLRARGAAEERAAILDIIERYVRRLAHGHGASGALVLQQIADEVERRGSADAEAGPSGSRGERTD